MKLTGVSLPSYRRIPLWVLSSSHQLHSRKPNENTNPMCSPLDGANAQWNMSPLPTTRPAPGVSQHCGCRPGARLVPRVFSANPGAETGKSVLAPRRNLREDGAPCAVPWSQHQCDLARWRGEGLVETNGYNLDSFSLSNMVKSRAIRVP